jgi:hypothetical protein
MIGGHEFKNAGPRIRLHLRCEDTWQKKRKAASRGLLRLCWNAITGARQNRLRIDDERWKYKESIKAPNMNVGNTRSRKIL